jgi:murein L,D-transpeptidase YcbB/YkuD
MHHIFKSILFFLFVAFLIIGCDTKKNNDSKSNKKELSDFGKKVKQTVKNQLASSNASFTILGDSVTLNYVDVVKSFYTNSDFVPIWVDADSLSPKAIEFVRFLDTSIYVGLFKNEYQFESLIKSTNLLQHKKINPDADLFAKTDLLFTNAFMHVVKDLKQGRIVADSISWEKIPAKQTSFFNPLLNQYIQSKNSNLFFSNVQPKWKLYTDLRSALHGFVNKMDTQQFTYLNYPYNKSNPVDSIYFIKQICKRFSESNYILLDTLKHIDSAGLASIVSKYQQANHLILDGKIGMQIIGHLNLTDKLKLKRIVLSLDRYKLESDSLPEAFVWVNLPAYKLDAWNRDSVVLTSNIVCGRPYTPTPILKSKINEIVLYPTWTVPGGIIRNEILPGLKRNSGYLARKGLHLIDFNGNRINPSNINWQKYYRGIPFSVQQASGDRNALGVMKFNFKNAFDVYLHDTNLRSLFKNSNRALSHGCVRVELYDQLAKFVAQYDSSKFNVLDTLKYTNDSIVNWLATKKRKRISVKNEMPLFINYITCEAANGEIIFHEDIYESDKKMIELYFNKK